MLTVIIIAKNEQANLRRCLESIAWANEIIVLDSGSNDNTVTIAKEFTPHVFVTNWLGYGVQKQRALAKAKYPWVLNLDADEVVSLPLKHAIQHAIQASQADAYRIFIRMNFYGQLMKYSASPNPIRLFKRQGAYYSNNIVHEGINLPIKSRIARLKTPIIHYCLQDLSHAIDKLNRYSSYSAKMRLQNKKPNKLRIIVSPFWMFFRCYFIQRGFLDGIPGLILASLSAQNTFYRGYKQLYPDKNIQNLP